MMSVNIEMPKLSDTMTEGTLIKWHKQVGDAVAIGDVIAEIETDKATMEMEAFDEGVLTEIRIQAGDKAPIGTILAILNGDSGGVSDRTPVSDAPASPAAAVSPVDKPATIAAPMVGKVLCDGKRVMASPLARRIAADLGVDLTSITGTGPAGRITKSDVETIADSHTRPTPAPSVEAAAADALVASIKAKPVTSPPVVTGADIPVMLDSFASSDRELVELSTMRKVIASRLLISKTTIPHFYLHLEVDAAPLFSLRRQVNEQAERTHGNKYSVNDFVLKAVINAAQLIPAVNVSYTENHLVKFKHIGLSVAIAVEDGLVTPVIREAETKSLLVISRAVKDFAARAKINKLKPNEFDGGTITVTNLGAWGIESFDAIINPPQATILAVGAAIEKPVVKNGQVFPGLRMNIGLACDHRIIDGAVAAQFLAEIRKFMEKPALMLL